MKGYIYALIDPSNNKIRYIGQTNDFVNRYKSHLTNKENNIFKNNWVQSLFDNLLIPEMFILDVVELNELDFWELFYIDLYKGYFDLLNLKNGGLNTTFINDDKRIQISNYKIFNKIKKTINLNNINTLLKNELIEVKDKYKNNIEINIKVNSNIYKYIKNNNELIIELKNICFIYRDYTNNKILKDVKSLINLICRCKCFNINDYDELKYFLYKIDMKQKINDLIKQYHI